MSLPPLVVSNGTLRAEVDTVSSLFDGLRHTAYLGGVRRSGTFFVTRFVVVFFAAGFFAVFLIVVFFAVGFKGKRPLPVTRFTLIGLTIS